MDGCSRQDPAYRPVTGRAPLAGPFPFQGGYALAIADLDAHPPDELEEGRLSRRALIGAAAVGAAATALPDDADAAKRKRRRRRKTKARKKKRKASVVVVGAGLAGLSAARELRKAGKSVIVIEARNRVGGRTFTKHVRGVPVDVGGQWIKTRSSAYGGPQALITALAKELGVPTFRSYYEGDNIFFREGQRTRYNPDLAQELPPDESFPEVAAVVVKADSLATGAAAGAGTPKVGPGISPEAPWSSPRAAELDAQTAETWIQANVKGARARNLTRLGVQAVLACESGDVSLLYFLFYIASADSLENLISTPLGAQESRFVGGAQQVSRKMAKQLGRRRLYRRSPVRSITQKGRRIVVDSDRVKVTARRVIVAVPPALADRIDYRPQLPGLREQLTQRLPMGSVIKCQAVYDRPFWRSEGLTGFALSDQGPVKLTFDNTPPGGSPGVLLGFVEGQEARELSRRSPGERRAAVLGSLARYFGSQALNPIDYLEHSWLEEKWSRGCYVGYAPPGVLTGYGPSLREPHGRIHWAGTETATRWAGYMDGAVQSGRRAAREVLARL